MVEGILISKTLFKERDIIAKILSRSGVIHTFYFYGGQGGGKKVKPTLLEVGRMLKISEAPKKSTLEENIKIAKEWSVLWEGRHIRDNFEAFSLMCFVLELISKIALPGADDPHFREFEGIFNVCSNFLFFLDDSLSKKNFNSLTHLNLFLIKLIFHLGIDPRLEECSFCEGSLNERDFIFNIKEGGFICEACISKEEQIKESDFSISKIIRFYFFEVSKISYKDYEKLKVQDQRTAKSLVDFIFYHFQLSKNNFKSLQMLSFY